MEHTKTLLTATDQIAIDAKDSNYINNKGANLYTSTSYTESVQYYHLAAAMGNDQAISNLGYCYLYGRNIEADLSLAIAYFKIALSHRNVDAAYKLGDIYGSDKWGVKDKELSIYYYRMAASFALYTDWEEEGVILESEELQAYPSLCFALGRELLSGEVMHKNIEQAYQFLLKAKAGYERELMNGSMMYQKSYERVIELLQSDCFDVIRELYEDEI